MTQLPTKMSVINYSTLAAAQADLSAGVLVSSKAVNAVEPTNELLVLVNNVLYTPQGTNLIPTYFNINNPKIIAIGNSINAEGQIGAGSNGQNYATNQKSFIHTLNVLSGQTFKYCRSVPQVTQAAGSYGNPNPATIDECGNYSYPGASLSAPNATYPGSYILQDLDTFFKSLIDKPDIIFLTALFENDLGENPGSATQVGSIQNATNQTLAKCFNAYPEALVIINTPGPNSSYAAGLTQANYVAITNWIYNTLPTLYPGNVFAYLNQATTLNTNTGAPIANAVDQGVHDNRYGALLKAKDFIKKFAWLFNTPQYLPSIDTASGGVFVNDPYILNVTPNSAMTATGFTGVPGTVHQLYSCGTYTGGQVQGLASPVGNNAVGTPQGLNLKLAGKTVAPPALTAAGQNIFVLKTDNFFTNVSSNAIYVAVYELQIVNVANLMDCKVQLVLNDSYGIFGYASLNVDITDNPTNFAGLANGDSLTIATAPMLANQPLAASNHLNAEITFSIAGGTPIDFTSNPAANPQVNINLVTIYQVDNNQAASVYTAIGANTYKNVSQGLQQVLWTAGTGGTITAATFTGNNGTSTYSVSGGQIVLRPGDSITVTAATAAPNITAIQLD